VLLNGKPCQEFISTKGRCQGDPLSPYLFILCAEVFSGQLCKAQEDKAIHGVKVAHSAPDICHLFFTDDSIFLRATREEAHAVSTILMRYQEAFGQMINLDKSELSFSQNVLEDIRNAFQGWCKIKAVDSHSKYLGLPVFIGRSKQQVFNFVQDRVWKKFKG